MCWPKLQQLGWAVGKGFLHFMGELISIFISFILEKGVDMKRYDERDVIFARMDYKRNTQPYRDYYDRHPQKKDQDDYLRSLPPLYKKGAGIFDPLYSPLATANFRFLADIKQYVKGPVRPVKVKVDPLEMSQRIKKLALYFGADLVGITKLPDHFYYSHRGRGTNYGKEIKSLHKYGIVYAVEMDRDMVHRAPHIEESIETTQMYAKAAIIGMQLSYYLRELGYEARNHMDGNYLLVAPLVAQAAGLGEIGRMGLLVTPEYGPRVRLGIVSTQMPLIADEPRPFGLQSFCQICDACAMACPARAIPQGPRQVDKGWRINHERCYEMWRKIGTDCGICLSSCPFSQPLSPKVIKQMNTSSQKREEVLATHKERYGKRPYHHQPLDLLK